MGEWDISVVEQCHSMYKHYWAFRCARSRRLDPARPSVVCSVCHLNSFACIDFSTVSFSSPPRHVPCLRATVSLLLRRTNRSPLASVHDPAFAFIMACIRYMQSTAARVLHEWPTEAERGERRRHARDPSHLRLTSSASTREASRIPFLRHLWRTSGSRTLS